MRKSNNTIKEQEVFEAQMLRMVNELEHATTEKQRRARVFNAKVLNDSNGCESPFKRMTFDKSNCKDWGNDKALDKRIETLWRSIFVRCYYKNSATTCYYNASVCAEWFTFSNFYQWAKPLYKEGLQLDKDIKGGNLKIYSPDYCCFVTKKLNDMATKRKERGSGLPMGVWYQDKSKKYIACGSNGQKNVHLGMFKTKEEAKMAYNEHKTKMIKREAYNSFISYEIDLETYIAILHYNVH